MATTAVVGSGLKFEISASGLPAGTTLASEGVTATADFYVHGKPETTVSISNEDMTDHQTAEGEAVLLCYPKTDDLATGNLYARISLSYEDRDTGNTLKQITVIDTGVRLVVAQ